MGNTRVVAAIPVAILLLSLSCGHDGSRAPSAEPLPASAALLDHLPRDPLAVLWLSTPDPADAFDALMRLWVTRPPWVDELTREIRGRLLPHGGPGMALVLETSVLDELMALTMRGSPDVVSHALKRSGVLLETERPELLDRTLAGMVREAGAEITGDDEVRSTRLPIPALLATAIPALPPGHVSLHWGSADRVLALGFDVDWVRRTLRPRPSGQRLRDGEDFGRSFPRLEPDLASLGYLNLPRLRAVVERSVLAQVALAGAPEWELPWRDVTSRLDSGTGLGRLTVRAGDRTVLTINAPPWIVGFEEFVDVLCTAVTPGRVRGFERDKRVLTLREVRKLAAGIEAFRLDHGRYPESRTLAGRTRVDTVHGASSRDGYVLCSGGIAGDCTSGDPEILLSNGPL